MTIIATAFNVLIEKGLEKSVESKAREFLKKILLPNVITREVVEKYFRKALRLGVWKTLKPESRALILVLRKFPHPIKSPSLKSILHNLFLEIELFTFRGKALFYGFVIAIKNCLQRILENVSSLLALGISYLNNPPMYRIYG